MTSNEPIRRPRPRCGRPTGRPIARSDHGAAGAPRRSGKHDGTGGEGAPPRTAGVAHVVVATILISVIFILGLTLGVLIAGLRRRRGGPGPLGGGGGSEPG